MPLFHLVRRATGRSTIEAIRALCTTNTGLNATSFNVMLEERFPRRVCAPEAEPLLQGDPA
jgi:hypothetical protein